MTGRYFRVKYGEKHFELKKILAVVPTWKCAETSLFYTTDLPTSVGTIYIF